MIRYWLTGWPGYLRIKRELDWKGKTQKSFPPHAPHIPGIGVYYMSYIYPYGLATSMEGHRCLITSRQ